MSEDIKKWILFTMIALDVWVFVLLIVFRIHFK